jgi:hypothetical protein
MQRQRRGLAETSKPLVPHSAGEAELHNVRAFLLNILELVEGDPGIEAASDDLYAVAKELAAGADRGTRIGRSDQAGPKAARMGAVQAGATGEGSFIDCPACRKCRR